MSQKTRYKAIYIPPEIEHTWKKFKEICQREGTGPSEKIREYIVEYVRIHEPGNPQVQIASFLPGGPSLAVTALPECPKRLWVKAKTQEIYCARDSMLKIGQACERCDDRERYVRMAKLR